MCAADKIAEKCWKLEAVQKIVNMKKSEINFKKINQVKLNNLKSPKLIPKTPTLNKVVNCFLIYKLLKQVPKNCTKKPDE